MHNSADSKVDTIYVPCYLNGSDGIFNMQYYDLLKAQFGPIVVSCAVSTLVVFLVVSWSSHLVHGERKVIGQKGTKQ